MRIKSVVATRCVLTASVVGLGTSTARSAAGADGPAYPWSITQLCELLESN